MWQSGYGAKGSGDASYGPFENVRHPAQSIRRRVLVKNAATQSFKTINRQQHRMCQFYFLGKIKEGHARE